jgi:hypothetical protein
MLHLLKRGGLHGFVQPASLSQNHLINLIPPSRGTSFSSPLMAEIAPMTAQIKQKIPPDPSNTGDHIQNAGQPDDQRLIDMKLGILAISKNQSENQSNRSNIGNNVRCPFIHENSSLQSFR